MRSAVLFLLLVAADDSGRDGRLATAAYRAKLAVFERGMKPVREVRIREMEEALRGLKTQIAVAVGDAQRKSLEKRISDGESALIKMREGSTFLMPMVDFRRPVVGRIGMPWAQFGVSQSVRPGERETGTSHETWTCIGHPERFDGKKRVPAVKPLDIDVVIHWLPASRGIRSEYHCFEITKAGLRGGKPFIEMVQLDALEMWGDLLELRNRAPSQPEKKDEPAPKGAKPKAVPQPATKPAPKRDAGDERLDRIPRDPPPKRQVKEKN